MKYRPELDPSSGCFKAVLEMPDGTEQDLGQQWIDEGELQDDMLTLYTWATRWLA